jgi:hypothetical protein
MQHFMSNSPWSAQAVIQHVQAEIAATPELRGGVLILDESANDKSGGQECWCCAAILWAEGEGRYVPGGGLFWLILTGRSGSV